MAFQTETTRHKARKHHRCDWCWTGISQGEFYHRYRYFSEERVTTIKLHPECHIAMIEEVDAQGGGFIEWTPGQERPTTTTKELNDS